ncbi:MAG: hypothetical protein ACLTB5_12000 [Acutalibacteraceae bacterium]
MSEGTSVGKIFLELDILSDLKSQLENIASKAQGQAKNSFESVGKGRLRSHTEAYREGWKYG